MFYICSRSLATKTSVKFVNVIKQYYRYFYKIENVLTGENN